ncbi:MAG: dienelactone hydrolase family protein [Nitrospinota bacterium]
MANAENKRGVGRILWLTLTGLILILFLSSCATRIQSLEFRTDDLKGEALLCRPEGEGPFPAVVYNHGLVVDRIGYQGASQRGYNLDGFCRALAKEGYLAFIPLRKSGLGNIESHRREVFEAVDYLKGLPLVDPKRLALMGFSRGGLLTLMVGVERSDLKALLILAPAPGRGHFARALKRVARLSAPVLLLVAADDSAHILEDFETLREALLLHKKPSRIIRYTKGGGHKLFWDIGYWWPDVIKFLKENLAG